MSNLITTGDVDKFCKLLKAGLKDGASKELENYTSSAFKKGYTYVSLNFKFTIQDELLNKIFNNDSFDISEQIKNLLNNEKNQVQT